MVIKPSKVSEFVFGKSGKQPKRKPVGQGKRTKLLIRAKGKCERCGAKLTGITPHIHHKNGNPKNNKLSNLQVICPNCHTRVRIHRKPKAKKETSFLY